MKVIFEVTIIVVLLGVATLALGALFRWDTADEWRHGFVVMMLGAILARVMRLERKES